jgi:septation ring formation regulator EzrA
MEEKTFELLTKMYSEFTNKFENIDKRFDNIDKRFENIDKRFENMDKRLDSIEGHVLRIENKQSDESKALYDGYKQTYENTIEIKNDIKDIKETLNVHEVKLMKVK